MSDVLAREYPAHLTAVRRHFDAALQAASVDQVAVYAGALHIQFLDDSPYPFKVNPQFKWWLPLTDAHDSFIVYSAGKKPLLLYYQPDDYWHVPPAPPAGYWVEHFDIRILKDADAVKKELPPAAKRAFIGEWRENFKDWGFVQVNPETLLNPLHYARAAKTPYELECMRRASASGVRGHIAAERAFRAGASEYEIHDAFVMGSGQTDDQHAYHAIVALNEHAATLHYQHWEAHKPAARHSFLIDAGTQYHGYASDITRTYSAAGDEFQALIDALDAEQQKLVTQVKPGVDFKHLHVETHHAVARILEQFNLIKLPAEAIVDARISSAFFPHGLGHLLGLQTHDVGGVQAGPAGGVIPRPDGHPFLRTTRVLEEGYVVTIEPGLYFIDALLAELKAGANGKFVDWARVEPLRKFGGIRIEDNVVAKAAGPENMTRDAFKAAV